MGIVNSTNHNYRRFITMIPMVYTAGLVSSSITTRVYKNDSEEWTANHGGNLNTISSDANGNVATGGFVNGSITTRLYNQSGTEIWNSNHGHTVTGIDFDGDGNVYAGGLRSGSVTVRKLTGATGSQLWSVDDVYDISDLRYKNGYVYTSHTTILTSIRKRNASTGSLQWAVEFGNSGDPSTRNQSNGIAVDINGDVYVAGGTNDSIGKYSGVDGSEIWKYDFGYSCNSIDVSDDGSIYVATGPFGPGLLKVNQAGTILWSKSIGAQYRVRVANDGTIYTGGVVFGGLTTRKYNSNGDLLWSANHGDTVQGIYAR